MKTMSTLTKTWFLGSILCVMMFSSLVGAEPAGDLIIFHAGSLTVPFEEIEKQFEAQYPNVDVLREAGGSTKMARLISEAGKPADIMASADFAVIDKSLIPEYADWNVRFATNQLVLCYTDTSQFADDVNADTWYDILSREGVIWGHSDPNLDPCGYRSLMVLQLAEKHYQQPGLYDTLIANRPEENIRAKSVDLVSLLKTGNMDYAWEYLSVAVQHELKYVILPDQINLGNYEYDDFYQQAVVEVSGAEPGTTIERVGGSVTYGVTMIKDAPNPEAAVAFLEFLMNPEGGLKVLDDMGQPPFIPSRVPTEEMKALLPEPLQKCVVVKE
jgi:molybdate/tungstate transport system substrate-binding protein